MNTKLLSLKNIGKRFDNKEVLVNICLEMQEGEVLTIIGPSGCGKTTLLRIIAGLEKSDKGQLWIKGRKMNGIKTYLPPQQRPVSMIFQNLALWPHLTVKKNISLGLKAKKVKKTDRNRIVDEMLNNFHIHHYINQYPHNLSAGEQQRVAIARALVLDPDILLLDEPFSHLDWNLKQSIISIIKSLKTSIILVTHDRQDALSIGGRLATIQNGYFNETNALNEICPIVMAHPESLPKPG